MTLEGPLPEQSESQRIGHLAGKCFIANCPNEWLWNDLSGTDDFGFDYQVQLVQARRLSAAFRLQLKGTVAPQRNASDEFFSIQLKASTVRYYDRATDPILFVMADLSVDPNRPANCALYSCWIHDELRRLNEQGLPPEQQYVTLKVPVANKLTTSTDVSAELHRYRTLAKVGDALDVVAERIYPSLAPTARADLVERIPRTIARSSPALLQSLVDETVAHWPEAPKGSFAWYLQEAT